MATPYGRWVQVVRLVKLRKLFTFCVVILASLVILTSFYSLKRHNPLRILKHLQSKLPSSLSSDNFSLRGSIHDGTFSTRQNAAGIELQTLASTALSTERASKPKNAMETDKLKTEKRPLSNQTTDVLLQTFPAWVRIGLRWAGAPLTKGQPQWQVAGRHATAFVYSAHFDNMVSPPLIRVIGLLHKMVSFLNVTCHYYDDTNAPSVRHVSGVFYHFRGLNGRTYVGAHAECPLPAERGYLPYAVSVRGHGDDMDTNFMVVHYGRNKTWILQYYSTLNVGGNINREARNHTVDRPHNTTQNRRGVRWEWNITRCFPAFQNRFNNHWKLAEMVAASLTMGVQRFVFYVESASTDVLRMLQMLQRRGLADVYPWNLHMNGRTVFYAGQSSAIQECFYRHLSSSRFVLFGDVDELFVPRKEKTLLPLLSRLFTSQTKCGAFTFRNVFFGLNRATQAPPPQWDPTGYALSVNLSMLTHTQRLARVWPSLSRSKPAVDPARVITPGIHLVYTFRKGYKLCDMDPSQGLLHHYRVITRKQSGPTREKNDTYLWHYAQDIIKHFQNLMQQFHDTAAQPYP